MRAEHLKEWLENAQKEEAAETEARSSEAAEGGGGGNWKTRGGRARGKEGEKY